VDDGSTPARKPPGLSWERWIERQISEAIERGEFEGLPGAGRPIRDLDARHDEMAWIRDKLRRERAAPPPPPAIQIRIDVDAALASLASLATEEEVRSLVEHLSDRIRTVNRTTVSGPPTTLGPMAIDEVVARWHRMRGAAADEG
jgi:DnaJ homologue, subfamily C, member 28, conserved domain